MIKRIIFAPFVSDYSIQDLHYNQMIKSMMSEFPEEFIKSERKLSDARNRSISCEIHKHDERINSNYFKPDLNTLMYGKSSLSDQIVLTIEL